ncbi:MAG: PEP-CTERM sorting domain-containing protein [Planctomycetota bacterium]|jgi:hypothetical protein
MAIEKAQIKARSQDSMSFTKKHSGTLLVLLALVVLLAATRPAQAVPISIKLTAEGLGLGNSDINKEKTVDPDISGFFTSSTPGEGSVLNVQTDGFAGPGTLTDPLLLTVTAQSRLDTLFGLPSSPHDHQAGVIFISKESNRTPNGRDEGLGVRAFKVDGATGLREIDGCSGLAKIEGSKDVSGGTGPDTYDTLKPNGAPHVDEAVNFNFNDSLFYVNAMSVEVFLSKFSPSDIIDLHLDLTSGPDIYLQSLQTIDTSIFEQVDPAHDKLWKLKFSGISQLLTNDLIDSFEICAIDDNPLEPSCTAEHFLISGITVNATPVPEPTTVALLGLGCLLLLRRSK